MLYEVITVRHAAFSSFSSVSLAGRLDPPVLGLVGPAGQNTGCPGLDLRARRQRAGGNRRLSILRPLGHRRHTARIFRRQNLV